MRTNRTKNTVALVAVAALALGCKQDRPADGAGDKPHLPVPNKLPPPRPAQPPTPAQPQEPSHAAEIDNSYATVLAMYNAPEGATPCESAYNAVAAEQDAAKKLQRESIFKFVAPKDEFFKLCQTFPTASQQCLAPHYEARNREVCSTAKPSTEQLKPLYVIRQDLEQPVEPGETPPHQ